MKKEKTKIAPKQVIDPSGSWLKLLMGIGVVLLFMFVAGTAFQHFPVLGSMAAFIEKEGIRSTAIYYTDIKEFAEAEVSLRYNFEFAALKSLNKANGNLPQKTQIAKNTTSMKGK